MSPSSIPRTFSLYISIFCLIIHSIHASSNAFLYNICSTSENFTTNTPYQANIEALLVNLYHKTPSSGFSYDKVGHPSQQTFGLALCRGDASAQACKSCVAEAGKAIRKRCPSSKDAIIWYDNCLVKYQNEDFFGQIDERNKFSLLNVRNVSNPKEFNGKVKELLMKVARKAYSSRKMYAAGEMKLGGSMNLYGMGQCTRDLSKYECKKCLEGAIHELPSCCYGKEGGRVVGGSCNVRYEIYPFLNA